MSSASNVGSFLQSLLFVVEKIPIWEEYNPFGGNLVAREEQGNHTKFRGMGMEKWPY